MSRQYHIAAIAGDGIGKEVIPEGLAVLQALCEVMGNLDLIFEEFPWGSDYYMQHGEMMPSDAIKILEEFDAIYLGAIGWPATIPDHITLWGLVLPIRKSFDQYINLRPVELLPGLPGVLRNKTARDLQFVVVRENTEGEYAGVGGRHNIGTPQEVALQTAVFTRRAIKRVMVYSFELARTRHKKVTSVTKSNACQYSMVLWDEVFKETAQEYPDVTTEQWLVDAMSARFLTHPETLDVVVASNLFGDILTDLGGALMGSLGLPPSANINPDKSRPSMFEAVHGSAPDIAGQGIANPLATILAGGMMLKHLGEHEASQRLDRAIKQTIQVDHCLTRDLGGTATCKELGTAICRNIYAEG